MMTLFFWVLNLVILMFEMILLMKSESKHANEKPRFPRFVSDQETGKVNENKDFGRETETKDPAKPCMNFKYRRKMKSDLQM